MTTARRSFVRALPAVGTAFAVGDGLALDDSPAQGSSEKKTRFGRAHPPSRVYKSA
jgi:hypothetical protein